MTKEERKEYMREYVKRNKDLRSKYSHTYYIKNRDRLKQQSLEYYYAHHEECKEYRRKYREEHLEYFHEYDKSPATKARRKERRMTSPEEMKRSLDKLYKFLEKKKREKLESYV